METCSICKSEYDGYGHNAYPFPGRCCDMCNDMMVIPARLKGLSAQEIAKMMRQHRKEERS
jgi:hypothetical protein